MPLTKFSIKKSIQKLFTRKKRSPIKSPTRRSYSSKGNSTIRTRSVRSQISRVRSNKTTVRSPLSKGRSNKTTVRSPLSKGRSNDTTVRSPLSRGRYPLSRGKSVRSPLSKGKSIKSPLSKRNKSIATSKKPSRLPRSTRSEQEHKFDRLEHYAEKRRKRIAEYEKEQVWRNKVMYMYHNPRVNGKELFKLRQEQQSKPVKKSYGFELFYNQLSADPKARSDLLRETAMKMYHDPNVNGKEAFEYRQRHMLPKK